MTAPATPERVALYRLYGDDDFLLYVGISNNPERRWYQHSIYQRWWPAVVHKEVVWHDDRAAALAAEEQVIQTERPPYNAPWTPGKAKGRAPCPMYDPEETMLIADAIRQEIADGVYPVGVDLRRKEIAAKHGVAIRVVSSALEDLFRDGLLVLRGNQFRIPRLEGDS